MPHITRKYRTEKIVAWFSTGRYDNYGNPVVEPPIEIECRWQNVDREVRSVDGSVIACDALVYPMVDVPSQSIFWRGALADLPDQPTNLKLVQEVDKVPSLDGQNFDRECFMLSYSNKLPTVASGT